MVRLLLLIPAAAFGIVGYVAANSHVRKSGRSPWGWPPAIWGLVYFLSLFLGAVLMSIATQGDAEATGPLDAVVGFRRAWFLRVATMVVGFTVGPIMLFGGISVLAGGNDLLAGLIVTLLGATLVAGGIRAVIAERRQKRLSPS